MSASGFICFPGICSKFGGAEWVRYTESSAQIKLPRYETPVLMARSALPDIGKWSSFTLADLANRFRVAQEIENETARANAGYIKRTL